MESEIVYLMYHELEIPGRPLCQTEPGYVRYILQATGFRAQMQSLKNAGLRGVNVSEALTFPAGPSVTITFDDGCETDLLLAAPILKEFGFGATFFVTSGLVDTRGYLSMAQVRELGGMGFEIGCHSMTHAYLPDLDDSQLHMEVAGAKAQLEKILGRAVEHFSCPGGRYDQRVKRVVREAGYRSLTTSQAHANSQSSDPLALARVAVMRDTSMETFMAWCHGRGLWQLAMRDSLRHVARRAFGNSIYDRVRAAALRHGTTSNREIH
jgi:peptidoglycan/xylan/chitin deacetylase (PgdA/CDA1 family)